MQIVHGPLRVGGGLEDGALVFAQYRQPVIEIRRMVLAWFGCDAQLCA